MQATESQPAATMHARGDTGATGEQKSDGDRWRSRPELAEDAKMKDAEDTYVWNFTGLSVKCEPHASHRFKLV